MIELNKPAANVSKKKMKTGTYRRKKYLGNFRASNEIADVPFATSFQNRPILETAFKGELVRPAGSGRDLWRRTVRSMQTAGAVSLLQMEASHVPRVLLKIPNFCTPSADVGLLELMGMEMGRKLDAGKLPFLLLLQCCLTPLSPPAGVVPPDGAPISGNWFSILNKLMDQGKLHCHDCVTCL